MMEFGTTQAQAQAQEDPQSSNYVYNSVYNKNKSNNYYNNNNDNSNNNDKNKSKNMNMYTIFQCFSEKEEPELELNFDVDFDYKLPNANVNPNAIATPTPKSHLFHRSSEYLFRKYNLMNLHEKQRNFTTNFNFSRIQSLSQSREQCILLVSLFLFVLLLTFCSGFFGKIFNRWRRETSSMKVKSSKRICDKLKKERDEGSLASSQDQDNSASVNDEKERRKNINIKANNNTLLENFQLHVNIIIHVVQIFIFYCSEKLKSVKTTFVKIEETTKSKLSSVPLFTSSSSSSSSLFESHGINHIAVIMDGNRRYGKKHHLDPLQGHWEGGKTLTSFVEWCMERNIKMCTAYAFSTENWKRSQIEVDTLMKIISDYGESMTKEAKEKDIRVQVLGTEYEKIPVKVKEILDRLEVETKDGKSFTLNLCISYGGQSEICHAVNHILREQVASKVDKVIQKLSIHSTSTTDISKNDNKAVPNHSVSILENKIPHSSSCFNNDPKLLSLLNVEEKDTEGEAKTIAGLEDISLENRLKRDIIFQMIKRDPLIFEVDNLEEESFSKYLLTGQKNIPPPDILLRTSGERRLSNFLLYQIAYTELFFIDKHWPELCSKDLDKIIKEYSLRNRRYGK